MPAVLVGYVFQAAGRSGVKKWSFEHPLRNKNLGGFRQLGAQAIGSGCSSTYCTIKTLGFRPPLLFYPKSLPLFLLSHPSLSPYESHQFFTNFYLNLSPNPFFLHHHHHHHSFGFFFLELSLSYFSERNWKWEKTHYSPCTPSLSSTLYGNFWT